MKTLAWAHRKTTKRAGKVLLVLAIAAFSGSYNLITAQQKETDPIAANSEKKPYTLVVKLDAPTTVSIKGKDINLTELAADLATHLKAPVKLSKILEGQKVTVNASDLTLEATLQMLAPQVFIDYRVAENQQTPVAIYLSGYNEAQPSLTAVVKGGSEAMLFEGDTEDGVDQLSEAGKKRLEESPLRVSLAGEKLTIRARKQPLMLVVLRVGSELGIPVELRDEPAELVTTDIVSVPVEEAIQHLSAKIALYVRADLRRAERRLLRLVLMAQAEQTQQSTTEQQ